MTRRLYFLTMFLYFVLYWVVSVRELLIFAKDVTIMPVCGFLVVSESLVGLSRLQSFLLGRVWPAPATTPMLHLASLGVVLKNLQEQTVFTRVFISSAW